MLDLFGVEAVLDEDSSSSLDMSNSSSDITSDGSSAYWATVAYNRKWMVVSASLSVVGTVLLCTLCIVFKKLQLAMWRAVFFSAISQFIFASMLVIGYTMPDKMDEPASALCATEGFVITVASSFSNAWLLFLMIILFTRVHDIKLCIKPFYKIELLYFVIAFFIIVATGILPLTGLGGMHFQPVHTGWCHIAPDPEWARFIHYGQQWFALILIVLLMIDVYVKVLPRLVRQRHHIILPGKDMEARRRVMILIKQVWIYPVLLVASWATTTTVRLIDIKSPNGDREVTSLIAAIVAPLMGFLQLIAFLLTSAVPREMYETCVSWCSNWKLRREYGKIEEPGYYPEYNGAYDANGHVQYHSQG